MTLMETVTDQSDPLCSWFLRDSLRWLGALPAWPLWAPWLTGEGCPGHPEGL